MVVAVPAITSPDANNAMKARIGVRGPRPPHRWADVAIPTTLEARKPVNTHPKWFSPSTSATAFGSAAATPISSNA